MADDAALWAAAKTLGGKERPFGWRVEADGTLSLRRVLRRKTKREVEVRALSPNELKRLVRFMGDGAWHPLAAGAQAVRAGSTKGGIGAFVHKKLGWHAQATAMAGHLAAVLVSAGLWEWNGQKIGMLFRQVDGDVARLGAHYAERRREEASHEGTEQHAPPSGPKGQEPPRLDLGAKFRAMSRSLRSRVDEVDSGGRHHVERGQRREGAVREFLRAHLPPRYGVTRGEVVAATGEVSHQVDVLVYDALSAPVLLESEGSRLLAAESVYAAMEVKPRLSVTELRSAVANIRSVKALSRAAALRGGGGGTPDASPPVFGVVFSFGSVDRRVVARELRAAQEGVPPSLWVDCVCVLDDMVVHRFVDAPGVWTPAAAATATPLACVPAGEDSLLYFWRLLLQDLNAKRLAPPDLTQYVHGVGFPEPEFV